MTFEVRNRYKKAISKPDGDPSYDTVEEATEKAQNLFELFGKSEPFTVVEVTEISKLGD